jgi:hypothetical protein
LTVQVLHQGSASSRVPIRVSSRRSRLPSRRLTRSGLPSPNPAPQEASASAPSAYTNLGASWRNSEWPPRVPAQPSRSTVGATTAILLYVFRQGLREDGAASALSSRASASRRSPHRPAQRVLFLDKGLSLSSRAAVTSSAPASIASSTHRQSLQVAMSSLTPAGFIWQTAMQCRRAAVTSWCSLALESAWPGDLRSVVLPRLFILFPTVVSIMQLGTCTRATKKGTRTARRR